MINKGEISQGANHEMMSANGIKITLLINEPLATRQIIGSSRSADTPVT